MQDHRTMDEFTQLPPYVVAVECLGCGVMGIEKLTDGQLPKDKLHD
jgi:hypothetical protein